MPSSDSITPLPLDPELLRELLQKLPVEVTEQLTNNWRKQTDALARSQKENRLLRELLRLMRVNKREKRACPHCPEQGVACAPLALRIIEKSLASDRLIIETIVNKYADYVPLYRQSAILERDSGVELSRATLCGWVMRVGELLRPVSQAMAEELLGGDYLQADETPVGVQMHDGRGQNHHAYLWQYSRPGGVVIFDFRLSRSREGPKQFLGHFNGILQTDGYSGYDRVGGPRLIHAGCWAHARRYFFQALEAHSDDRAALALVATIDELFGIDAQAREQHLSLAERDQLRQQKARPILESIKSQIQAGRSQTLPMSALAKACNYTLTLWNRLTRFLDHPILELSTNAAENAIRPVALGRNWIHFGSQEAGPRIAAILSIIETCRRLRIPIRNYLASILPGLADLPVKRVAELTPTAWAARS